MEKNYLERIKSNKDLSWFWDKKDEEMFLICTDDLDSLMSCLLLLTYRKRWSLGGFFDYRDGLYLDNWLSDEMNQDNTIWIDCSSIKQGDKCISNHLTSISGEVHNTCDINLNTIDNNYREKSYFDKYNLSTYLLIASMLAVEGYYIDNEVGRVLSLCLDSGYKAFYQPDSYKDSFVQARYLNEVLELGEIYEVQTRLGKKDFIGIVESQNLHSKLIVDDNGIRPFKEVDLEMICKYLCIDIDLSVLDGFYGLVKRSKSVNKHINMMRNRKLPDNVGSYAITGNWNVSYSLFEE